MATTRFGRLIQQTLDVFKGETPFHKVITNFTKIFSGQIMVVGLALLALMVNTRALGPAMFGVLVAIQAVCELVAKIAAFQTWQATSRYGAQAMEREDGRAFMKYFRFGLLLDTCAALAATLISILTFYIINQVSGEESEYLVPSYIYAVTVITAGTGAAIGILRVTDKFGINIGINVGRAFLLLMAALALDYYEQPLVIYIYVFAAIMAVTNLTLLVSGIIRAGQVARRLKEDGPASNYDRSGFLRFAMGTSVASTMNAFRQRGELLLISVLLGDAATGLYGVAYKTASIFARFAEAGRQSVYPEFAKLITGGQSREARRIAVKATRTSFYVAAPLFLIIVFFGATVLTFISGPEFAAAHPNLIWLSTSTLAYTLTFGLGPYVQIGFGSGRYLQLVGLAFAMFLIGAVAGPLLFQEAGAGMGAGFFGLAIVALLYWQIYAVQPEKVDEMNLGSEPKPLVQEGD